MAAVIHGIFFGRVAPSEPAAASRSQAPALVVGHPRDPIHLAADALMVAEEMPNARHVGASSILEWRCRPDRLNQEAIAFVDRRPGTRPTPQARHGLTRRRGQAEWAGWPYYRDEAIVLRTQKLGEADRIITLLTRSHGRVRAVAKGVRRTRPGSGAAGAVQPRRPPARRGALARRGHPGRDAAAVRRPRWAPTTPRYTAGTVMLETAERLVVEDKEPALQQYLLLVGALRAICETGRPPARCSTRSCCARWRSPATRRRSTAAPAAALEGPHVAFNPSAGGMLCAAAGCPGSARPATETVAAARRAAVRGVGRRAGHRRAAPAGGEHAGRGVPRLAPRARAEVAHAPAALTGRGSGVSRSAGRAPRSWTHLVDRQVELLQQPAELLVVVVGPVVERRAGARRGGAPRRGQHLPALGGEVEQRGAPVGGVGGAARRAPRARAPAPGG